MEDRELIERFQDTTLPPADFSHREHVRVGWLYLEGRTLPAAIEKFCTDLIHFATAHGASDKYHATITYAFMVLINERCIRGGRGENFAAFARDNPDLFEKNCLARYYSAEVLASPLAKQIFVLPRV